MENNDLFTVRDYGIDATPRFRAVVRAPKALGRMGNVLGFNTPEGPFVTGESDSSAEGALDNAFLKLGKIANLAAIVEPVP